MADKLAWMSLNSDDQRLPKELRDAIAKLDQARDQVETMVRKAKPAPKGRAWRFSYRYGVAIALATASGGGSTSYFD